MERNSGWHIPRVGGLLPRDCITSCRYADNFQLGVQIMDESDQLAYGFDLLDPTKFVPEEVVPITPLGKMTLNMNPKNYFAETEQIGVSNRIRGSEFAILTSIRLIVPARPRRSWHRLH